MGALFIGATFIDRLNREWHVDALLARAGKGGPIIAGAAFSIAWTPVHRSRARRHPHPCRHPGRGAPRRLPARRLLAWASPIPFLITALAFSRATTAFGLIKRHYRAIVGVGGGILIAMGILILTGGFTQLNIWAQELTSELGLNL